MKRFTDAINTQPVKALFKSTLDLLLPQTCLGCRTVVQTTDFAPTLCAVCWGQLHSADMLAATMAFQAEECAFDSFNAPFLYEGVAMDLVKSLKYGGKRQSAKLMAQQMLPYLEPVDVLIPVPLHKKRFYRRAYNQSADIAKYLSQLSGTPHMPQALERVVFTQSQVGQKAEVRRAQLKGAFKANVHLDGALEGKRIALIDDVCTTGSTAHECALALQEAGALHIQLLTFAYVEPKVG